MISLFFLPLLFSLFYYSNIKNTLNKTSIEIIIPEGGCGAIPYPQNMFHGHHKLEYSFTNTDENLQIDSFYVFNSNNEKMYSDEKFYYELDIDKECSYNLFIGIMDILDQDRYSYLLYNDKYYAINNGRKGSAPPWKYKSNFRSNDFNHLKLKYEALSKSEQITIGSLFGTWCILLSVGVISIYRKRSVA